MTLRRSKVLWWLALALVVIVPLAAAAFSPLLQYREPVYIAAGFAGIAGFAVLFLQPLLARNLVPGLYPATSRKLHKIGGSLIVLLVAAHIAGLWITSPPDVIDVLLFRSPTPFSLWGALSMWAIILTALLAMFRQRLTLSPRRWRIAHLLLGATIVVTTALHALLIDGTMETISKFALSGAALLATAAVVIPALWRIVGR